MDYSQIIQALNQASAFDLYRVHSAIGKMLDDPKKVGDLRNKLSVGSQVEYFVADENRSCQAKVIEFKRTRVLLENLDGSGRFLVPHYFINIHGVDTNIEMQHKQAGLDRNEVKVGDRVAFLDKQNVEITGVVVRLNPKTVSVDCTNSNWRVPYTQLFKVLSPDIDALPGGLG